MTYGYNLLTRVNGAAFRVSRDNRRAEAGSLPAGAAAAAAAAPTAAGPAGNGGWAAGTPVAAVALFTCYLLQSRTVAVGSDGASQALQAWDCCTGTCCCTAGGSPTSPSTPPKSRSTRRSSWSTGCRPMSCTWRAR